MNFSGLYCRLPFVKPRALGTFWLEREQTVDLPAGLRPRGGAGSHLRKETLGPHGACPGAKMGKKRKSASHRGDALEL